MQLKVFLKCVAERLRPRYRIVADQYMGYEIQRKMWWFPFWIQWPTVNSSPSPEVAIKRLHHMLYVRNVDIKKNFDN